MCFGGSGGISGCTGKMLHIIKSSGFISKDNFLRFDCLRSSFDFRFEDDIDEKQANKAAKPDDHRSYHT